MKKWFLMKMTEIPPIAPLKKLAIAALEEVYYVVDHMLDWEDKGLSAYFLHWTAAGNMNEVKSRRWDPRGGSNEQCASWSGS